MRSGIPRTGSPPVEPKTRMVTALSERIGSVLPELEGKELWPSKRRVSLLRNRRSFIGTRLPTDLPKLQEAGGKICKVGTDGIFAPLVPYFFKFLAGHDLAQLFSWPRIFGTLLAFPHGVEIEIP